MTRRSRNKLRKLIDCYSCLNRKVSSYCLSLLIIGFGSPFSWIDSDFVLDLIS